MPREQGLRDRKKTQTRERLADAAARLFAQHGYDAVTIVEVARAAEVSDQTVYNYFETKQELVLDRADDFVHRYHDVVVERPIGTSPARALSALTAEDVERYRHADLSIARGEFPAQCLESPSLRRYALEFRERQADAVAAAIIQTTPHISAIIARAHSAALISVAQSVIDRIGAHILDGTVTNAAAEAIELDANAAFDDLDRHFLTLMNERN